MAGLRISCGCPLYAKSSKHYRVQSLIEAAIVLLAQAINRQAMPHSPHDGVLA
jgi:hypothetical protein